MTTTVAWICLVAGLALFGVVFWLCATKAGTLGEDDPTDVEPAPSERPEAARHAWRNNSAKTPKAE
jgi:hypothetical protein